MGEAKHSRAKKISKIVGIVSTVVLVICIGVLLYATISYSRTGLVKMFGYSFHTIQTGSMEPEIKVGDLVVVKEVPYSEINVGDDILFKCEDTNLDVYGKYIVHRVIDIIDPTEGIYKTKGIHNPVEDDAPSKAEGKVVKVSTTLGGIFNFVTQGKNILFVAAIGGIVIFGLMELCSVIVNASKIKQEKDKEKMNSDKELQEKIKKELEEELKNGQNADGGEEPAPAHDDPPMDDDHKELTMDGDEQGGDEQ